MKSREQTVLEGIGEVHPVEGIGSHSNTFRNDLNDLLQFFMC